MPPLRGWLFGSGFPFALHPSSFALLIHTSFFRPMLPSLLLALTITTRPARVSVGDLVTVEASKGPIVLQKPVDYEVVSLQGNRMVVRTFQPKAFTLSGTAGGEAFQQKIDVGTVLKPKDDLKAAPLAPPRAEPEPLLPWIVVGAMGLLAIGAWTWVALRLRDAAPPVAEEPPLTPALRFVRTVEGLRHTPDTPRRWAQLADALRDYLAATRELSPDLTTTELLTLTHDAVIADVLHQGDLEKFSPWGARPVDFEDVAQRALELAA
jgi:hypothetical protein